MDVSVSAGATSPAETDALSRCVAALEGGCRFLLTMHQHPDGDALGSALALALALAERGAEAVVYSAQGVPSSMTFLPGVARVVTSLAKDARFDVTVACDAGHQQRLGPDLPDASRRGVFLNLDHHLTTPHFGDVNLIDVKAASVGVLVHRILKRLGHPISKDVGICLWVSLTSDTGNFRYSNTDAECMRIAAELVERGVKPWDVASLLQESQPLARVKLLGEVLKSLEVGVSGRVAWISVTQENLRAFGAAEEVSEGFISYPRSIAGVEVAVFLREERRGKVKLSLRSRGTVDVAAIAGLFAGGGHHNAAGATLEGTLEEARARVLREVERAVEQTFT